MNNVKKWVPTILHAAATVAVFLQPSVDTWAKSHPAETGVLMAWTFLLHFLKSPRD